jgi:excisionase family DNA binding protein
MNTVELPQGLKPAYTLNETAALLGVSRATINRLIRAGRLRVARIGWRTVRVTDEAVRESLAAGELANGFHLLERPQGKGNRFEKRRRSVATDKRSSKPLRGSMRCPGWVRLPRTPANLLHISLGSTRIPAPADSEGSVCLALCTSSVVRLSPTASPSSQTFSATAPPGRLRPRP